MRKVGLYQAEDEYPSLHLVVTDNVRYLKGRKAVATKEAAMAEVEKWLDQKLRGETI